MQNGCAISLKLAGLVFRVWKCSIPNRIEALPVREITMIKRRDSMSSTVTKTRNTVTKITAQLPQGSQFLQKNVLQGNTFRLLIALVSGGLFAWLASFIHNKALLLLDIYFTRKLQKKKNRLLIGIARAISFVNAQSLLNISTVPVVIVLWIKRLRLEAGLMAGLFAASSL